MTTPGGVPNLPQGALTLDTLASKLQDMTGTAMKSRAVDRFPSIFNDSTGLDPSLDITPFGILTRIWAEVNSLVATADPADIQGPEDLPPLVLEFIQGLPVIGQFVDLFSAILGDYTGDDETLLGIQALFAPIRALVTLLPNLFDGLDLSDPSSWDPATIWETVMTTFLNTVGLGGFTDFTDLLNGLFDGSSGSMGSTGKTVADVLSALQTQFGNIDGIGSSISGALASLNTLQSAVTSIAPNAITALEKAVESINILGIRINKPASMGANPTSLTSFTLGHFSSGGSVVTSSLTAGNAIAQRFTVPELATYGFLEIMAAGTSVTNIFVNIYKIDPVTNAKTALFNSSNIAATIPSSLNHVRILLPGMAATAPGDELLLEIVNGGSNALTVATKATGLPANTNEVIQNVAFSRSTSAGGNSPTSLTSGQGSYSATVPYAVIGIANVPAGYHPPDTRSYTTAGSTTLAIATEWPWLVAGDLIDYGGWGGGGGGGSSQFPVPGQGGGAAVPSQGRLVYGTDVKIGSSLTLVRGGRGAGGNPFNGSRGGDSTLTYTDPSNTTHTITFAGGGYGAQAGNTTDPTNTNGSNTSGQAAADLTLDGITHYGGTSVGAGSTGQSPGAGGGGALPYLNGASGGVGELDLYIQQA